MKLVFVKVVSIVLLLKISLVSFAHKGEDHSEPKEEIPSTVEREKVLDEINENYLARVEPIFKKKCLDCHGQLDDFPWYHSLPFVKTMMNEDMSEAKVHLDMTDGFPFKGHGNPEEDLVALKNSIEEESMPPLRYRLINWNTKVTDLEKKKISNWVADSISKLEKLKPQD